LVCEQSAVQRLGAFGLDSGDGTNRQGSYGNGFELHEQTTFFGAARGEITG